MWPPLRDFARLMTASAPRSSMSCTFCSSSRMVGTAAHHPTLGTIVQNATGRRASASAKPGSGDGASLRGGELYEVLAGEARVAECSRFRPDRFVHSLLREIPERVRGDVLRDLLHGMRGGDQFLSDRRVDAVVAGPAGGRRADPHVHFLRTRIAEHLDDLAARGAPDGSGVHHPPRPSLYP